MALSRKSLAGPGYIILNGIRVLNIISFLAVITGSVVMLIKTSVATKFFFFDAVSHVLTAVTSSKYSIRASAQTSANPRSVPHGIRVIAFPRLLLPQLAAP